MRGYYAMPLLWGEQVIGWANINVREGKMETDIGFVGKRPKDKKFHEELDVEIERIRRFCFVGR